MCRRGGDLGRCRRGGRCLLLGLEVLAGERGEAGVLCEVGDRGEAGVLAFDLGLFGLFGLDVGVVAGLCLAASDFEAGDRGVSGDEETEERESGVEEVAESGELANRGEVGVSGDEVDSGDVADNGSDIESGLEADNGDATPLVTRVRTRTIGVGVADRGNSLSSIRLSILSPSSW